MAARSKAPPAAPRTKPTRAAGRAAAPGAPTYTFTAPLEAEQFGNAQFLFIHLPDHLQALPVFSAPGRRRQKRWTRIALGWPPCKHASTRRHG